jgi:hypothetical protein
MEKMPEWDPSLPKFNYKESEREEMRKRGMSDEQIDAKELEVTQRLIEKQFEDEQQKAA